MVLLRKKEKPPEAPSSYRLIYLLDEGKLFKCVTAAPIKTHLAEKDSDLDCQYDFRESQSTINTIQHVKILSKETVCKGKRVLAVSLNITYLMLLTLFPGNVYFPLFLLLLSLPLSPLGRMAM